MSDTKSQSKRKRVLSGMRPTGRLHIGHYFGALSNWLKMQNARLADGSPEFDSFHFVADWHALTTHYADSSQVATNTLEVATDWLAVGLDPQKVTLFIQSAVPEHAELHLLLSMITPLSWLERVPTYKEQIENLRDKDLGTYGFLGYPLLQSADIVMYGEPGQSLLVPVGADQVPHVELTREIVRSFDVAFRPFVVSEELLQSPGERARIRHKLTSMGAYFREPPDSGLPNKLTRDFLLPEFLEMCRRTAREWGYDNFLQKLGPDARYFALGDPPLQEPRALLTETPRVPGTDGRRMAKSYGNAIWLSDTPEEIRVKAKNMMTDPQRVRKTDPGRPEVCPVFAYHNLFPEEKSAEDWARIERVDFNCRNGKWGCLDCKKEMADALVKWITPIQKERKRWADDPAAVWKVLEDGSAKAREVAKNTMERVRRAVFDWERAGRPTPAGYGKPQPKSILGGHRETSFDE